jgi:hypothetical protein
MANTAAAQSFPGTLTSLASGALVWFESLDRPEQLRLLKTFDSFAGRRNMRSVTVVRWVGEKVRAWNFPLVSLGEVAGAVVMGFCELPAESRQGWINEVVCPPVGGGK